ncbi:DNA-binding transcriptional regulator, CsgD family [Rhizobiales bacterium GAS113]|nr:DNA-binding transcriptional regulator, CsgD family [Rhizobiales bacterium GAS113]
MRSTPAKQVAASIYETAFTPNRWPDALDAVTGFLGAVGAAHIVLNKQTGGVERATFIGPSAELKADYVGHYASLDPYSPLLLGAPNGGWLMLSEALPASQLRGDEWYNDFVIKAGAGDIIGTQLFGGSSSTVILGIHKEVGTGPFAPACLAALQDLSEPLRMVARLDTELRYAGWKSSIASHALDRLSSGVIVVDDERRIIETNLVAERILRRHDGLTMRGKMLRARRAVDDSKLGSLLVASGARTQAGADVGRMLVGRLGHRPAYPLTLARLPDYLAPNHRPLTMILVADPDAPSPTAKDFVELFCLSPAESRLAVALMGGKALRDIAPQFGVQITTLRTQLSSILKKLGVKTQADLMRVFSNIPIDTGASRSS